MNSHGSWLLTACHDLSRLWLAVRLAVASRRRWLSSQDSDSHGVESLAVVKAAMQLQCQSVEAQSGCQGALPEQNCILSLSGQVWIE